MFLLKIVFWLSLVILLIPAGKGAGTAGRSEVSTLQALSAARAVWDDLSTFCDRNRDACETGHRLLVRFGEKARSGASMLHGVLVEDSGEDGAADVVSGSVTR